MGVILKKVENNFFSPRVRPKIARKNLKLIFLFLIVENKIVPNWISKQYKKRLHLTYFGALYLQKQKKYTRFCSQVHRWVISASSGRNELGKKSKKKPSVMTNFHFLVNFIRHTGPMVTMVTRYTGTQAGYLSFQWSK